MVALAVVGCGGGGVSDSAAPTGLDTTGAGSSSVGPGSSVGASESGATGSGSTRGASSGSTTDAADTTSEASSSGGCLEGETQLGPCDDDGNAVRLTCNAGGVFEPTGTRYGCTVTSEPGVGTRVCPSATFTRSCWPIEGGHARVDWVCEGSDDPRGGTFSVVDEDYCTATRGPQAGQHFCPGEVIARNNCPTTRNYYICPETAEEGTAFESAATLDCNLDGGSWEPLHRGVELRRWYQDGHRFRALRIDLCDASLRVAATESADRGQRTSSWAAARGMLAAVNGGFFLGGYAPDGCVAFGGGTAWPDAGDTDYRSFIAFGEANAGVSPPQFVITPPYAEFPYIEEAVCGDAVLVAAGVGQPNGNPSARARTGAGLSLGGDTLYLMTVDEVGGSSGVTVQQFGAYFAQLGVDFGINLDGGGSSTLYAHGWGVVSNPSDGSERVVANHLGVFIEGGAEGYNCPR